MTTYWVSAPILTIVQGIYAKYYGLSLIAIASVILAARLFDAVTDLLIGYFSDRHHRSTGSRKPFILVGGLLLIVSSYFLYVPFMTSIVYLGAWLFVFYLAQTLFEIPHNAWASELALTSKDKSTIYSFRSIAAYVGAVLFYVIPLLPFFDTRDVTPETLQVSVVMAGTLMVFFLILCLKYTPNGVSSGAVIDRNSKLKVADILRRDGPLKSMIKSIVANKPLCIFLGGYMSFGLGVGLWYGLIFLYVDSYLGLGEQFAQVFLVSYIVGILATTFWCKLAIKFGKKMTMGAALIFIIVSFIYTGMLRSGEVGLQELLILIITNTVGTACILALAPALLSEITDFSAWKFRRESTASYFSLYTFMTKVNAASGAALGLAIAGWYGFDASVTTQSSEAGFGLFLAMTILPSTFMVIAFIFTTLNPINSRRHDIVRRSLYLRALRANEANRNNQLKISKPKINQLEPQIT